MVEPGLQALLLYLEKDVRARQAQEPHSTWWRPDWAEERQGQADLGGRRLEGRAPDGSLRRLDWEPAHDAFLLRPSICWPEARAFPGWRALRAALEAEIAKIVQPGLPRPWAISFLYHAYAPDGITIENVQACFEQLIEAGLKAERGTTGYPTPFGWFLPGEAGEIEISGISVWQRTLALITPAGRAEKVNLAFVEPLTQGFSRIELYLHKAQHHARQHELVRTELDRTRLSLQEGMLSALKSVDLRQIHQEKSELDAIARQLTRFLAQKAQTEILLNSLCSNRQACADHLQRVKLETPCYADQLEALDRRIRQMEADLENARVIAESAYAFQDIQRSRESAQIERASMLLGSAAAVLAGAAIFNNFLDIWNLAMEGSGLNVPHPLIKVALGLATAFSLPLGALAAVRRRTKAAAVWFALGILAILMAVLSTIWVNR